jgi:type IV fimbrial biogenesis protein FimT
MKMAYLIPKRSKGFSLTELMIVIVVVAILGSIAIPAYTSLIYTSKISSYASQLHAALLFTRSEAIKRGRNVNICRSSNAQSTSPSCAMALSSALTNTGWGEGWLIYVDLNNDNVYSSGDILIRVQGPIIDTLFAGAIMPQPNRNRLTFNSTGQTFGTFLSFSINRPNADSDVSHDRFICIASGGRARVGILSCSSH